jgi:hypothetical protein
VVVAVVVPVKTDYCWFVVWGEVVNSGGLLLFQWRHELTSTVSEDERDALGIRGTGQKPAAAAAALLFVEAQRRRCEIFWVLSARTLRTVFLVFPAPRKVSNCLFLPSFPFIFLLILGLPKKREKKTEIKSKRNRQKNPTARIVSISKQ